MFVENALIVYLITIRDLTGSRMSTNFALFGKFKNYASDAGTIWVYALYLLQYRNVCCLYNVYYLLRLFCDKVGFFDKAVTG